MRLKVGSSGSVSQRGTLRPSGTYAGTFNPASGLPTTGTGRNGAILKGDFWSSSGAGTITDLEPFSVFAEGDLIYSNKNNAQVVGDFFGNKGTGGTTLTNGNGTTANGSAVDLGGTVTGIVELKSPAVNGEPYFVQSYFQNSFAAQLYRTAYVNYQLLTGQRVSESFTSTTSSAEWNVGYTNEFNVLLRSLGINQDAVYLNLGSDATGDTYTRNAAGYLIRKGITTTASTATLTVDSDTTYLAIVTAQAEAITIANPTGTPFVGQEHSVSLKDDGTSQTITFGNAFVEFETFPTATTAGKRMYLGFVYNGSGWDYMGSKIEL